MEVITYSEWINQGNRQRAQEIALLAAQAGVNGIVYLDSFADFPAEGGSGLLYLAKDTGKAYSWNSTRTEYVRVDAGSDYVLPQATSTELGGVIFGTSAGTSCEGNDPRLTDSRTPKSHTHGNITNAGKIGSSAGVVITDSTGAVSSLPNGTEGEFLKHDGTWGAPNISVNKTPAGSEPSVLQDGEAVIWLDSTTRTPQLTIKFAGYDLTTIKLSGVALTPSV